MLKPLLPSLREKKRYLFFDVITEKDLSKKEVYKAIEKAILQYSGLKGAAEAGIKPVKSELEGNKGVIRISNKATNITKAAITLINNIGNTPAIVHSIGMSGTLKTGIKKYCA